MSYENQCNAQAGGLSGVIPKSQTLPYSPTLAENIDNRIQRLHEQIAQLENVKNKLQSGRMLDIPLEDLRVAMNY